MDKVEEILKEHMNDTFSTTEKLKAFLYHIGMVMFGPILCPEKHQEYIDVFEKFVNMKNEVPTKLGR